MPDVPPARRFEKGLAAFRQRLARARRENLKPPPKLSLSEWANQNAVLSAENSAQTGKFRAFGYQRGLWDAITDPTVTKVSMMKSARVGYSLLLSHVIGYFTSQDPSPILMVHPRTEDAERFSKTNVAPMLRDTPCLAAIQAPAKTRDSGNTILVKSFLNSSSLTLVGANSPAGLRALTVRIVLFDEVDGYPVGGAGSEGDQIALGTKRSETFWNRKIICGSTPTISGVSRIEKLFLESDQRHYHVPCPHCGEKQVLEFGTRESLHGIKWHKDPLGNHLPDTAFYQCKANGCIIEPNDKTAMVEAGEWVASAPFNGHAGFHINALYSPFVNASWSNIVSEWLRVKDDPLARPTFFNLVLGLPYQDRTDAILAEAVLAAQSEVYSAEVPDGVGILTAGCDVQADRVEIEVVGWGRNEESWSIDHQVIEGDTSSTALWNEVDTYLKRKFRRADGRAFGIEATCIDSGYQTQQVYAFCRERIGRRIYAIKGESVVSSNRNPIWPNRRPTKRMKGYSPYIVGVNAAKDLFRSRLAMPPPNVIGEPYAGFCHFPADRDIGYFAQLIAERLVTKTTNGQRFRIWDLIPGRRNEALDIRVYAMAALQSLIAQGLKLNRRVADLTPAPIPSEATEAPGPAANPVAVTAPPQPARQTAQRPQVTVTIPKSPSATRASRYA
jgi:phage terminase large subunit GpA-like protein